jgi:hypothetical protein
MSPTDPGLVSNVNRNTLREEGARSYLEALTALKIFKEDVQSVCKQTIESRLTELLNVLMIDSLEAKSIVLCGPRS